MRTTLDIADDVLAAVREVARREGRKAGEVLSTLARRVHGRERGYRRLAIVGIPCQVYALRALEAEIGFERLYVIGTPCSDNATTENFHRFLALLDERPETIAYLEFRADYHVELRFDDGRVREIPFLQLPVSKLPRDFFPLTCRTCVDYTNVLADVTMGYMGGEGEQWLLVRNERAAGGLPLRGTPRWLRPLVGWLMPRIGPREQGDVARRGIAAHHLAPRGIPSRHEADFPLPKSPPIPAARSCRDADRSPSDESSWRSDEPHRDAGG